MSREPVLRVAINAPLSRLFDYLPPSTCKRMPEPGCRVKVPFGRRTQCAMLLELGDASELPMSKLRRAHEVLDEEPLLRPSDLSLIRFTSDYYHHPIGEVVAAALPALLRQGKALHPAVGHLALTDAGLAADVAALERKAPRQAGLLALLRQRGPLSFDQLDQAAPGWKRLRRSLVEKNWVKVVETRSVAAAIPEVPAAEAGPALNPDQSSAVRAVSERVGFSVSLLDGVTGSGKTEVYLSLIRDVLARSQQVLVLVPEIGLTPQFVSRLQTRLASRPVILHSSLSDSVRRDAWRAARDGSARLIVGTRSAVFAPMKSPGLIVVDEEHDGSFKQQEGLRYSARDLAIVRAKELEIPVVLGSATPSLETLQRCAEGMYRRLALPVRAGHAVPPLLSLVDLNRHPSTSGLSRPVIEATRKHRAEGGQVLVFLNRRGFAPTLVCQQCAMIAECSRCDARMTVHARRGRLMCHHCGAMRPLDTRCRNCGGAVKPLGHGTERLEDALSLMFPDEHVSRIDSDSTRQKGTLEKALDMAASGETGILIGTQILSKGHHFPKLTLVVVIDADQGLFSTDFRGTERLAQSLMQVAGRAGREKRQGQVMIQTAFASHPFWHELLQGGYERVAASALAEREKAAWPPFSRLALLRAAATRRQDTHDFLETLRASASAINVDGVRILGPVSAPMERLAGRYRAQLLFQSRNRQPLYLLLQALRDELETGAAARRVRWSIDVDPIELF
jgi:primosomal protein N' (replication factor Y)